MRARITSGEITGSITEHPHHPLINHSNKCPISLEWSPFTPRVDGNSFLTLWIYYFNVRCRPTQGHSDFLEAGVKGQLPSVADPTGVVGGQQVNLGRLHGLLHPLQNLQHGNVKNAGITDHFCCRKHPVGSCGTRITSLIRFIRFTYNNIGKGSQVINLLKLFIILHSHIDTGLSSIWDYSHHMCRAFIRNILTFPVS